MLEASGDGFSDFVESGGGKGDDSGSRSAQCLRRFARRIPIGPEWEPLLLLLTRWRVLEEIVNIGHAQ
jgi:hypothetical protein